MRNMLLIKGVRVVDGRGGQVKEADVLVNRDRVVAIGKFPHKKASQVVEGRGAYLLPGIIDAGALADRTLLPISSTDFSGYLRQGVTSVILGQDGYSLAPLPGGDFSVFHKHTHARGVNVDWFSFQDFLKTLSKLSLPINVGSFAGLNGLYRGLFPKVKLDLTEKEKKVFEETARQALRDGAFGLSLSREGTQGGIFNENAIADWLRITQEEKGLLSVALRRQERTLYEETSLALKAYFQAGGRMILRNFEPKLGDNRENQEVIKLLHKSTDYMEVYVELMLSRYLLFPLYYLLPLWARRGTVEEMRQAFQEKQSRRLIEKEIEWNKKRKIFLAFTPHLPYLKPRLIKSKAELLSIMEIVGLRAFVMEEGIDMKTLQEFLGEEKVIPVSSDPRLFSLETGFLSYLQEASKEPESFSKAVSKITGEVADRLKIKERGEIAEGKYADLVLYNQERVERVWVNGEEMYDGKMAREAKGNRGRVLIRKAA